MRSLADFPVTRKWPAQHPDRIQLYSLPTPNGVKASIALEELGLAYEAHLADFGKNDQMSPAFRSLDPNNKIPAIVSEAKRLLAVLEQRLEGRAWIMGDEYTIADIATFPWVRNLVGFCGAGDLIEFAGYAQVKRGLDEFVKRPAVQAGPAEPARS